MKKLWLILALTVGGFAQQQVPVTTGIGTTLPQFCNNRDLFYNVINYTWYTCGPNNVWSLLGTGGGGGGGTGSVSSVALSVPSTLLTISGSPITTTGTIALGLQPVAPSTVLIGDPSITTTPTFRILAAADLPFPTNSLKGAVLAKAQVAGVFFNGLGTDGAFLTSTIAASDLTNGVSGSGAICLVTNCTLVTPTIASFVNATHNHTTSATGGIISTLNGVAWPSSPSVHQVPVVTASNTITYKTVPDCTATGGNHLNFTQSTDAFSCGTNGGGSSTPLVSDHHAWGPGEQAFTHGLSTLNPPINCYITSTGAVVQLGNGTTANTTAITYLYSSSAIADTTCNFVSGSGATGAQGTTGATGATGATGSAGPAVAGYGSIIVTNGVASAIQGTTTTLLHGNAGSVAPAFSQVVSADLSTNLIRRTCDIPVNDQSSSTAVTNAQLGPQTRLCFIPNTGTVVEVDIDADAGTPNVIVGRYRAGSVVNLTSQALATAALGAPACSNTTGAVGIDSITTCTNTLQNTTLNAGDRISLVSGTAGGVAKLVTVHVIYVTTN